MLELTPDELLSTTRAVRKRLDFERPVPLELVRECIEIATQAPTGSNQQGWQFVVVTDPDKRAKIAGSYKKAFDVYEQMRIAAGEPPVRGYPERTATQDRVQSLGPRTWPTTWTGARCSRAVHRRAGPTPCPGSWRRRSWASILPAAWSFCLAARARGLGTAWTTLHLVRAGGGRAARHPVRRGQQCALIPVAYSKGTDFKPGPRVDLDTILHVDSW